MIFGITPTRRTLRIFSRPIYGRVDCVGIALNHHSSAVLFIICSSREDPESRERGREQGRRKGGGFSWFWFWVMLFE
ncbi:hypothetical protein EUGRSUZ_E03901 [Eucalyptus grandis]|uniref:Uncharacterized protein n=2 Tax=Eucalyptus grandis TaxID=71139 RepID=A0ACC3L163_EUCGR|nr:hypothetical protein EUGRSUZ_E03901 [Eucalyptus grandis]